MKSDSSAYFFKGDRSCNIKGKRGFCAFLVIAGVAITIVLALISLLIGSRNLGIGEVSSIVVSIVRKGGHNLVRREMLIYMVRMPQVVAAITVGVGLAIAGAVYQAIFKNPLAEPYIMGVSSGAGTFAIAAMWMGNVFFGANLAYDPTRIITSSIVGGLLAFGCTMLIARCAGGKSVNYVLAGVIVGMLFSAIQSILMIWGCTKVTSAVSWLCGSFGLVGWGDLRFVLVPIIILSAIPLIWARSLNLILLGEDQATQTGMNAKRFSKIMLVVASVLTAFCVSFCGIIGFVGLVVPHISRILVGSDHRLMLPVSMVIGASFLLIASSLSRMLLTQEGALPVGMITAVMGVPIFAYLLMKRGHRYGE